MLTLIMNQFGEHLRDLRRSGADDEQLAAAWRETTQTLPDPSPETDSAHPRSMRWRRAGAGRADWQWWRPPTTLGRCHHSDGPEPIGIQWAEAYYRGYAMVIHVDGDAGAWVFRAYSCDPADQQVFRQERGGFATLAEAYEAAMRSQINAVDQQLG